MKKIRVIAFVLLVGLTSCQKDMFSGRVVECEVEPRGVIDSFVLDADEEIARDEYYTYKRSCAANGGVAKLR